MSRTRVFRAKASVLSILLVLALVIVLTYGLYPWTCRRSATPIEAAVPLPGDAVVEDPRTGYTLATTIEASPARVWPWLVQMGQGRGGFYTHEWIENLLGANIQNADRLIADYQDLAVGDSLRLTPDPYLGGQRGQYIVAARVEPPHVLVFRQTMPNNSIGSWAFVLRPRGNGTRLLFRRRGGEASYFDRLMLPGYYLMDMGMLSGIKTRAEKGTEGRSNT